MPLKERLRTMGFGLPNVGEIRSEMNAKFGELVDRLDTVIERLTEIRDELRTSRGAP